MVDDTYIDEKLIEYKNRLKEDFSEEDLDIVVDSGVWRYLKGRTFKQALLDGDEKLIDETINSFQDGTYL